MKKYLLLISIICVPLFLTNCSSGGSSSSGTTAVSGTLAVSSLSESVVVVGESSLATISLSGSVDITTPVTVNIHNSNSEVMSVSPTSCSLTTANNSCLITLTSESLGNASFTASASNYTSVSSESLQVVANLTGSMVYPPRLESVGIASPITVIFSAAVESSTVNSTSFKVGTTPGGHDIVAASITVAANGESATFVPESSSYYPINSRIYVTLTQDIKAITTIHLTPFNESFTTQPKSYLMYVLGFGGMGVNGDLKTAGSGSNGITGADNLCAAYPPCPFGKTCKAIIVDGVLRAVVPNPINWVLESYTQYSNLNESIVGVTGVTSPDGNKPLTPYAFSFPLINSITDISNPNTAWTGIFVDQESGTISYDTCNGWTSSSSGAIGEYGYTTETSTNSVSGGEDSCNNTKSLYCVEQQP